MVDWARGTLPDNDLISVSKGKSSTLVDEGGNLKCNDWGALFDAISVFVLDNFS